MRILGLQEMKGTSKATGKPYDSVIVYVSEERDGVVGVLTDSVFAFIRTSCRRWAICW